jgi:hypothetical protein
MSSTAIEHAVATISGARTSPIAKDCGAARRAPVTRDPALRSDIRTRPAFSSKIIISFCAGRAALAAPWASTKAVPTFG